MPLPTAIVSVCVCFVMQARRETDPAKVVMDTATGLWKSPPPKSAGDMLKASLDKSFSGEVLPLRAIHQPL